MGRYMKSVCCICGKKEEYWNSQEFKHQDFCNNCVKNNNLKLQQYFNGYKLKK